MENDRTFRPPRLIHFYVRTSCHPPHPPRHSLPHPGGCTGTQLFLLGKHTTIVECGGRVLKYAFSPDTLLLLLLFDTNLKNEKLFMFLHFVSDDDFQSKPKK